MMKPINKFGIGLIGICVLLLLGSPTYAGTWTIIGSGCTVDEASLSNFDVSSAQFRHETGRTGTIVERCNIVEVEDTTNWDRWDITYHDPDGSGNRYRVYLWLYQVNQTTGALTQIATFDSNTRDALDPIPATVLFNHNFDFTIHAYYLYVTVFRSTADETPIFYRAELRD
jgi:hypothetical protein